MAQKMKPLVKFALTAGAIVGVASLFRNEKVKKWTKENANKLRDSSLGSNVAELSDWSVERIYELRDPESKTSRLVKVLPAGNYIQRALEVILPEHKETAFERGARKLASKAEEWGDKAREAAERAGSSAHDFADRAGAQAKEMGHNANAGVNSAAERVSEKATDAAERVDGDLHDGGYKSPKNDSNKEHNHVKSAS